MLDLMGFYTNMNLDLLLECAAELRALVDRLYDKICQG